MDNCLTDTGSPKPIRAFGVLVLFAIYFVGIAIHTVCPASGLVMRPRGVALTSWLTAQNRCDMLSSAIALFGIVGSIVGFSNLRSLSGLAVCCLAGLIGAMTVDVSRMLLEALVDAKDRKSRVISKVTQCLDDSLQNILWLEYREYICDFDNIRVQCRDEKFYLHFSVILQDSMRGIPCPSVVANHIKEEIFSYVREKVPDLSDVFIDLQFPSGMARYYRCKDIGE
eukprot:CAMPEP_0185762710 /NCGR_PEP_ID=MMETSP1174-20130828/21672_1 /TAXON_ID=35687 /ORGANISM="Dictyocha speculum, Strain CCMP1381" /LENGTH=225 /DNA_ID=CAMNT_0028444493 /DNA_START=129 /DNA_END=803 /DNA_ORIENTATION=+